MCVFMCVCLCLCVCARAYQRRFLLIRVHLYWGKSESESDIASRWVHRQSNLMFTLSSNKDHGKNSLSHRNNFPLMHHFEKTCTTVVLQLILSVGTHCDSGTCANGGTCVDLGTTFGCHCPLGYHGNTCQLRKFVFCVLSYWCYHVTKLN